MTWTRRLMRCAPPAWQSGRVSKLPASHKECLYGHRILFNERRLRLFLKLLRPSLFFGWQALADIRALFPGAEVSWVGQSAHDRDSCRKVTEDRRAARPLARASPPPGLG